MNVHDETLVPASRRRTLAAAAAAACLLAFSPAAFGQVQGERPQEDITSGLDEPLVEQVNELEEDGEDASAWSGSAGVLFATDYYFRGIVQDTDGLLNGGLIAQPYIDLGLPIFAAEDGSYEIGINFGIWNSFGSEQETTGANPENWYESDLYAGLGLSTGDFEFGLTYTFYTSPNGSFSTVQEILGSVGYEIDLGEDPDVDDDFAFTIGLGALIAFELDNTAFGADEGIYVELGVEPGTELEVDGLVAPVSLSFPIAVGFSLDDYYVDAAGDNEFYGYVSVAAAASIPLPLPSNYGSWTLTPQVQALFLGAEGLELANNEDSEEFIGGLSLDFEF